MNWSGSSEAISNRPEGTVKSVLGVVELVPGVFAVPDSVGESCGGEELEAEAPSASPEAAA